MNMYDLEVYKSPFPKIRLGKDNDGGYVIADIVTNDEQEYDCLISCGISDDISFEIDFMNKYKTVHCYAFDGTINSEPLINNSLKERFHFIRKNISYENTETTTNLVDLIKGYNKIFLKMDIEGSEYAWFDTITRPTIKRIKQIAIEFHHPMLHEYNWRMLSRLTTTHWLIHLVPNEGCGFVKAIEQGSNTEYKIPYVFECTYILKDHPELNSDPIPNKLIDQAHQISCIGNLTQLVGYPFTKK
jgi:hypothetical protein